RVVSLGDSFAWGAGVDFDDAYPQRLERALVREDGERWEVVNLALPGMRTVDQAATLSREGMAYSPDVVLLGYVLNDSEEKDASEARRAAEWTSDGGGPPPSPWDRSRLFRFVRGRFWATGQHRRRLAAYRDLYAEDAPGWRAARQALLDIGAACQRQGVPLVVAVFPLFGNPLDERYPFAELHARVGEAARAAGARVVDLLPAYRGLRWELLVVDGGADEHPNEIAHRIAADTLLPVLKEVRTSLP
ncbi:MAG: SGNH/GDSL hydrolase family protein, partial [Myxococcaceae bacterium]|nr:SGNH/GDSL hydrolase family protein [Myxococcaceae bacterium]